MAEHVLNHHHYYFCSAKCINFELEGLDKGGKRKNQLLDYEIQIELYINKLLGG